MNKIEKEFETLQNVIEENKQASIKNPWQIAYHYWRFYHLLNQKIADAKNLQEEIDVIEKYISFYKGKETAETGFSKPEKEVEFDPRLRDILSQLDKERNLFSKNLRRIKAQKTGKISTKRPRPKKGKWVKS